MPAGEGGDRGESPGTCQALSLTKTATVLGHPIQIGLLRGEPRYYLSAGPDCLGNRLHSSDKDWVEARVPSEGIHLSGARVEPSPRTGQGDRGERGSWR